MSFETEPTPIESQYSILETFSGDNSENINQIVKALIPIMNPDLYSPLADVLGIGTYPDLEDYNLDVSRYNLTSILKVKPGLCVIKNTELIINANNQDSNGQWNVDLSLSSSYIFSGDLPKTNISTTYTAYVAIFYNPTEDDTEAKLGIINSDYYDSHPELHDRICILKVVYFSLALEGETKYYNMVQLFKNDPGTGRDNIRRIELVEYIFDMVDGGWVSS